MNPAPDVASTVANGRLDGRTRTALVAVAIFGAMFAVAGGIGWGAHAGLSVAIGAAVAAANLYGMARILGAMLGGRARALNDANEADGPANERDGASGVWGVLAVAKVFLLFGGVWLLMSAKWVDPLPLVIGWGALPIGIALGSLFSDRGSDQAVVPRGRQSAKRAETDET